MVTFLVPAGKKICPCTLEYYRGLGMCMCVHVCVRACAHMHIKCMLADMKAVVFSLADGVLINCVLMWQCTIFFFLIWCEDAEIKYFIKQKCLFNCIKVLYMLLESLSIWSTSIKEFIILFYMFLIFSKTLQQMHSSSPCLKKKRTCSHLFLT